jgi:excisionase family DNA binding protein
MNEKPLKKQYTMTAAEVAGLAGVQPATVRNHAKRGALRHARLDTTYKFNYDDVMEWIRVNENAAQDSDSD